MVQGWNGLCQNGFRSAFGSFAGGKSRSTGISRATRPPRRRILQIQPIRSIRHERRHLPLDGCPFDQKRSAGCMRLVSWTGLLRPCVTTLRMESKGWPRSQDVSWLKTHRGGTRATGRAVTEVPVQLVETHPLREWVRLAAGADIDRDGRLTDYVWEQAELGLTGLLRGSDHQAHGSVWLRAQFPFHLRAGAVLGFENRIRDACPGDPVRPENPGDRDGPVPRIADTLPPLHGEAG